MDYELAKELKDAGFPHTQGGKVLYYNAVYKNHPFNDYDGAYADGVTLSGDVIYVPTLSELIEACGGKFKLVELIDKNEWLACGDYYRTYGEGTTPEEAVARLWLALNKKQ